MPFIDEPESVLDPTPSRRDMRADDNEAPFTYGNTRPIPPPPGTSWLLRGIALLAVAVVALAVVRTAWSVIRHYV